MKEKLIGFITSRRVLAAVAGAIASVAVPYLNRKLGLGLDPAEVTTSVTGVLVAVVTYIVARTAGKFAPPPASPPPASVPEIPPEVKAALAALAPKK